MKTIGTVAPSGADRMYWSYRYNSVCCPLKVFLIGKLAEYKTNLNDKEIFNL